MAVCPRIRCRIPAPRFGSRIPFAVINDEQIEPSVIIKVSPDSMDAPHLSELRMLRIQACRGRDIRESAIPVVVEKCVLLHAGDEEVYVAVVVIISRCYGHVVPVSANTGCFRDV